jgi:hypothetical protein
MESVEENRGVCKASNGLSNSAKLLAGYMKATGVFEAKAISETLGIPLRTVQRLKLEIACANDAMGGVYSECGESATSAKHAADGATGSANSATHGVSEAPNTPPVAPPARVEETNLLTNLETTVENNTPLSPRKPKRTKSAVSSMDVLAAFELWNETALNCGLAQAHSLTPERKTKIGARLGEVGLEGWKRALANIERSSYLTGKNNDGWRADLKFFVRPDNFHKVHDGGYGNGRHAPSPTTPRQMKWIAPTPEELRAINA